MRLFATRGNVQRELESSYGSDTDDLARALSGNSSRKSSLSGRNGLVMGSDVIVGSSMERDNFNVLGNKKALDSEKKVDSEKQTVNGQKIESEKPSDREDAVTKAPDDAPTTRCRRLLEIYPPNIHSLPSAR